MKRTGIMKKALIIIPENGNVDVCYNGVNTVTIISACTLIAKGLARKLLEEAEKAVGPSAMAQEQYLKQIIEKCNCSIEAQELLKLN